MNDSAMTTPSAHHEGIFTSLVQLFGRTINDIKIKSIRIPRFQRDYAQGRQSEQARHVRERFITDLLAALDDENELHLDFIFGDVKDGTLYPLDGQQRLTTLFLLHCYLAWHQPEDTVRAQSWHAFDYDTRPGAREFCQFLTQCRPDISAEKLSAWLYDHADYLPTWKHDPTIQGMLVVLDDMHKNFRGQSTERLHSSWLRLTALDKPAISFLLLPVAAQDLDKTLYVKMNSRGRPLTEFENFKAELESLLRKNSAIDSVLVDDFARKIDTDWADLFWLYRGDNNLIDEELMRYLRFLFEVRAWKRGLPVQTSHGDLKALTILSESLLGSAAPNACADFDWIVQALDVWLEDGAEDIREPKAIGKLFSRLFTRDADNASTSLRIFNFGEFGAAPVGVNMFHACCMLYGTRSWSLSHTVLLYGTLQGLMHGTPLPDLHPRLRLLRNLIEASRSSEIRADTTRNNMPSLLHEVETIMADGPITEVTTFNKVQVRNEQAKQALVAAHPTLQDAVYFLEDHELLRGGLTVFDLDPEQTAATFANRASVFPRLFDHSFQLVSAALLVKGHQGREHLRISGHRLTFLGAPRKQQTGLWEDYLRIRHNEPTHPGSAALMSLLDEMAAGESPQSVVKTFLENINTLKDWRYYIAKYEIMRGERLDFSGNYVLAPGPGYAICMPKRDSCDNRSNHHDAYLMALAEAAEIAPERIANDGWPRCFPGYETEERHLKLRNSGIQIRCVKAGWQFSSIPEDAQQRQAFESVAETYPHYQGQHLLYAVPQNDDIDTADRIDIGSRLLRELVDAGL